MRPDRTRRTALPDRAPGAGNWDDDEDDKSQAGFKPLTREEAAALRKRQPMVNPWAVMAVQAGVGIVLALLAGLWAADAAVGWSALYGAATVVVPAALVARGMTSRLSSQSPMVSAVSVMVWETMKICVSVLMLALAPRLLRPLSWPVLLVAMAVCLSVYWFALLWRGRKMIEIER